MPVLMLRDKMTLILPLISNFRCKAISVSHVATSYNVNRICYQAGSIELEETLQRIIELSKPIAKMTCREIKEKAEVLLDSVMNNNCSRDIVEYFYNRGR